MLNMITIDGIDVHYEYGKISYSDVYKLILKDERHTLLLDLDLNDVFMYSAIIKNPKIILPMIDSDASDPLLAVAIMREPSLIINIMSRKKYPYLKEVAIRTDYRLIQVMDKPTVYMQNIAISICPDALGLIENPDPKAIQYALSLDGRTIKWVKKPTKEQQILAVSTTKEAIKYIKKPCSMALLIAEEGEEIQFMNAEDSVRLINADCDIDIEE